MNCCTIHPIFPLEFTWREFFGIEQPKCPRHLDPGTGRFLQSDPNPGKVQTPITIINRYAYAGNNPILFKDPSGAIFGIDDLIFIAVASLIETALTNNVKGGNFLTELVDAIAINTVLSFVGAAFGGSQLGGSTAWADVGSAALKGVTSGLTSDAITGAGLVAAHNGWAGADTVSFGLDLAGGAGYAGYAYNNDQPISSTIGNLLTGGGTGPSGIGFNITVNIGTVAIPATVSVGH